MSQWFSNGSSRHPQQDRQPDPAHARPRNHHRPAFSGRRTAHPLRATGRPGGGLQRQRPRRRDPRDQLALRPDPARRPPGAPGPLGQDRHGQDADHDLLPQPAGRHVPQATRSPCGTSTSTCPRPGRASGPSTTWPACSTPASATRKASPSRSSCCGSRPRSKATAAT